MSSRKAIRAIAVAATLTVAAWAKDAPAPVKLDLGGADRFLTYVATDKPIYRIGEKVFVRAALLKADTHTPLASNQQNQAMIEIRGPKGDIVAAGMAQSVDSVAGFSWTVPNETAGGEYSIKVTHPWTGYSPGERKFDVRAYRAPRLKSQTVFVRDGYGPGDLASASLHVDRAEGGIPAGAKVTIVARVDGAEVHRSESKVDASGNASVQFKLPAEIARGEGTLAWIIEDGGVVETASKTIPILLQTVDMTMYPEGGDLVAGLNNRVYIEAFTPAKKPADLSGVIVDSRGTQVGVFKTEHEGRGRFDFRPERGEKYALKILQPSGIGRVFELPKVKDEGVVLRAMSDVNGKGEAVKLRVETTDAKPVKITLSKREMEIASVNVEFVPEGLRGIGNKPHDGFANVSIIPPAGADGVLVATVWGADQTPLAERLIFRQPAKGVKVHIAPEKPSYIPGELAKMAVKTTDEDGKPVGAVVGIQVTDDSVLQMIEKREQAPRLPAMVFLETDVKNLADAEVYLNYANPKAGLATDLLLGTQGWRRFAMMDVTKFLSVNGDLARRALAVKVTTRRELERLNEWRDADDFAEGADRFFGIQPRRPEAALAAARPPVNEPRGLDEAKKLLGEKMPQAQAGGFEPQKDQKAERKLQAALDQAEARDLDKNVAGGKLLARRRGAMPAKNDFVVVREFAHLNRPDRAPNDRVDFAETLYFHAGLKTDAKTGEATFSFTTSDAVTSFKVAADVFTADGAIGAAGASIESVQPFYAEPKLPLEVTSGDVIELPVAVVNATGGELAGANVAVTGSKYMTIAKPDAFTLTGNSRQRKVVSIKTNDFVGVADMAIAAAGGAYSDKVNKKLSVAPIGFPVELASGGLLNPDGSVSFAFEVSKDVVAGSISGDLSVYPTPLANLTGALEALVREPYGCFEQTSSTSYPLTMAQQYFTSHVGVDPKVIERSRDLLEVSYKRLIGFECKTTKGFEWFGADPGHEALSAYGLLQFTDMSSVREVDKTMLDNTRKFILSTRDGKGGFKRERQTLHTWLADPEVSNGYILWALLETGEKAGALEKEIGAFKDLAGKSANSYAVALGANVLFLAGDKETAKSMMDRLAAKQGKDGSVDGATMSIVGSGGEALKIEATSLAMLAWLKDPAYTANVENAIKYLAEACKGGRFGSTQSTVLALKAIVAYDKARAHPKASGVLRVAVDGKSMGEPAVFGVDAQGAIKLQNVAEALTPGQHTITLAMERGSQMPYSMAVKYHALQPPSSPQCKVGIEVALKDKELAEGNITEANIVVTNKAKETIPTPIAIVGIPGGLEVRHDQLKELAKSGKIAAYEVRGREVILYWRQLAAEEKVELPISLVAAIPGTYTGPASRTYLYYTDEHKNWTPGVSVRVTTK